MSAVIGRFFLELTESGNLIGEYSNQHSTKPLPESAYRESIPDGDLSFVGEYKSTSFEPEPNEARLAILRISQKEQCSNIYSLKWSDGISGEPIFVGEAMYCRDLLIGDYRSC